jgi:hypothetical protein
MSTPVPENSTKTGSIFLRRPVRYNNYIFLDFVELIEIDELTCEY